MIEQEAESPVLDLNCGRADQIGGPLLRFFLRYDRHLDEGLISEGTSFGRWLLNLAFCLSREGHQVDIYTILHQQLSDLPSIKFYDITRPPASVTYDVAFINGWSAINYELPSAKRYVYLDYTRSWDFWQTDSRDFLYREDVVIGYPFRYLEEHFQTGDFASKSFFFPHVIKEPLVGGSNFSAPSWAISLKYPYYGYTYIEARIPQLRQYVMEQAAKYGNSMVQFPAGGQPERKIWEALTSVRLLHPLSEGGCCLEAVVTGVVPILIFNLMWPSGVFCFMNVAKKHNMYLEHPVDLDKYSECIRYALSSKDVYTHIVEDYRLEIADNMHDSACRYIGTLLRSWL